MNKDEVSPDLRKKVIDFLNSVTFPCKDGNAVIFSNGKCSKECPLNEVIVKVEKVNFEMNVTYCSVFMDLLTNKKCPKCEGSGDNCKLCNGQREVPNWKFLFYEYKK